MSVSSNLLSANTSEIETDTSGWTAGANTTLAQSTRFFTGSKSLLLTRTTSAGAASATTATRVAVTAGTVYTAYAYAALIVAAAGRTLTVQVDWWAASTGGTAISPSATAMATLANSTAWNTPPPILIATAPAGAAYASVTVTVAGMSTSEAVAVDSIALGPANRIPGNLLDYNTQGCEVSGAGWAVAGNCSQSRASSTSFEGWYSLSTTSIAAGDMINRVATFYPATAGTEYLGYLWVNAPVTGSVLLELRWYDSGGGFVSVSQATWTVTASTWTRVSVIGSTPAGASQVRLSFQPAATAAAQTWLTDQAALMVAPNEAGNALGYGPYGTEVGTSAWSVTGGALARSTTAALEGVASLALTCTGGVDAVLTPAAAIPVTAGTAYVYRPAVRPPTDSASYTVRLDWLDGAGSVIRQTTAAWSFGTGASSSWSYSYTADVAPTGAVAVRPYLTRSSPSAGEVWLVDRQFIGAGGLTAQVTSLGTQYGARITVTGLTTGARTTWGLWRTSPDGTQTPVRGYGGDLTGTTITGDIAVADDFESPLGTPVTYYLKTWTAGTDWISYSTDSVTLPYPDELRVVIKDPSLPAGTRLFTVTTSPSWTRAARQGEYTVRRRARPVILTDVRASRKGSLTLTTETLEERDALWWLLDSGHTLMLQWPAGWGEDDVYVQVGDVEEGRPSSYAGQADREWTLALTEVDRPVGALIGSASRTWQTILSGYATWADVLAHYTSWFGVLTGVEGT
ncbi:hypothetical protein [Kitasatospora fiedleri]|uniref:hypothetical protein n=1 Tax=Kitasatospora fiedleri TaxID=2991545 RepID=UPI00249AFDC6|nr:hypothetical protein [Kitasatospora fiedleri]